MSTETRASARRRQWWTIALALLILLPSFYGFGSKFLEFVALLQGDADGAFAVMPVANYLLASIGFFLLFAWAVMGGMFRDVERPKYSMLDNERRLDEAAHQKYPGEIR